jgi:hypothetical protein
MIAWRWFSIWRLPRHKIWASAALVSYLATAFGVPISPPLDKDRSQPFPCQSHACGCRCADDCWRHCCCFSSDERLAWAQAHQIRPPREAEAVLAQGWHAPRLRDLQEATWSHEEKSCARCTSAPRERAPHKEGRRGGLFLSVAAMRCHGMSTLWVTAGTVLPPPVPLDWHPYLAASDWLWHSDVSAPTFFQRPLEPPPRSVRA